MPWGLGGEIYVSDALNHRIRVILTGGTVETLAGGGPPGLGGGGFADGRGDAARFRLPGGLLMHSNGLLYVVDKDNHRIRTITVDGEVRTLAGSGTEGGLDGPAAIATFAFPVAIAESGNGSAYVTQHGARAIRRIDSDGTVSTVWSEEAEVSGLSGIAVLEDGGIAVSDSARSQLLIIRDGVAHVLAGNEPGNTDGPVALAQFNAPTGLLVGPNGELVIADHDNHLIRRITGQ